MKTLIIKERINKKTNKPFYIIGIMAKDGYHEIEIVSHIKEVKPNETRTIKA